MSDDIKERLREDWTNKDIPIFERLRYGLMETAAYPSQAGRSAVVDALATIERLEGELGKWQQPFDQERFDAAEKQASHKDSLAAQGVYITALEHALKHLADDK